MTGAAGSGAATVHHAIRAALAASTGRPSAGGTSRKDPSGVERAAVAATCSPNRRWWSWATRPSMIARRHSVDVETSRSALLGHTSTGNPASTSRTIRLPRCGGATTIDSMFQVLAAVANTSNSWSSVAESAAHATNRAPSAVAPTTATELDHVPANPNTTD